MTESKKKPVLVGLVLLIVFGGVLTQTLLKDNEQMETVKVVEPSKVEVAQKSIELNPVETSSSEVQEDVKGRTISENISDISRLVQELNNFDIGFSDDYERIVEDLAEYNVTVDPGLETPYGEYEYTDNLVFVSVSEEYTVTPYNGSNDYNLSYKTRTAVSENYNGYTVKPKVAKELRRFIKSSSYTGQERYVNYRLNVSEDGMTAVLTLESGRWW